MPRKRFSSNGSSSSEAKEKSSGVVNGNYSLSPDYFKGQLRTSTTDSGSEIDDLGLVINNNNNNNNNNSVGKPQPQGQVRAGLRSLSSAKSIRVKFVNHSGKEVQLYWINYDGECEKAFKIPDGKNDIVDTYESHPWIAANARNKKVHHAFTINNNLVYYPALGPNGGKYAVAEIRKAPEKLTDLQSRVSDHYVTVKFINKTGRPAYLEWINYEGNRELRQTIQAGQSWTVETREQSYWITTANKDTEEGLLLNYGWYYSPTRSRSKKERVYITDYI